MKGSPETRLGKILKIVYFMQINIQEMCIIKLRSFERKIRQKIILGHKRPDWEKF